MEDVTQGKERQPIPGPVASNCFKYVKTNVPGPGFDENCFMEEFAGCSCVDDCDEQSCPCVQLFGPAYDDNGRLLETWSSGGSNSCRSIFECGDNCACDYVQCGLRAVQKGVSVALKVSETTSKGFGLEAGNKNSASGIKRLSFVCEYAGEVVGENEAKSRLNRNQREGLKNFLIAVNEQSSLAKHCLYVDPCSIGNIGRFINHSCDPNLVMIPVRVNHPVPRLALFARRDIRVGEELTFDYSGRTLLDDTSGDTSCLSNNLPHDTASCLSNNLPHDTASCLSNNLPHDTASCLSNNLPHDTASCQPNLHQTSSPNCKSNFVRADGSFSRKEIDDVDKVIDNKCDIKDHKSGSVRVKVEMEESQPSGVCDNPNRTKCLCGSKNCAGYLPYDGTLFGGGLNKS